MLSFVVAGIACIFSALCYAEFASMVPVAGSAYTYAYATLGELFAWIIGWDLVLEYTVGASTVAHGWSKYFQDFIKLFNGNQPLWPHVVGDAPIEYAVKKVLDGEMVVTYGGHFLLGAWAMVVLRDYHDGRDFAEEDVRLQIPMGAIDLAVARRFPGIGNTDWRKVDFTRFSKTRNPQLKRYEFTQDALLAQLTSHSDH